LLVFLVLVFVHVDYILYVRVADKNEYDL